MDNIYIYNGIYIVRTRGRIEQKKNNEHCNCANVIKLRVFFGYIYIYSYIIYTYIHTYTCIVDSRDLFTSGT